MNRVLGQLTADERRARVMVVDSDLEGSCGLKKAGEGHYTIIILLSLIPSLPLLLLLLPILF